MNHKRLLSKITKRTSSLKNLNPKLHLLPLLPIVHFWKRSKPLRKRSPLIHNLYNKISSISVRNTRKSNLIMKVNVVIIKIWARSLMNYKAKSSVNLKTSSNYTVSIHLILLVSLRMNLFLKSVPLKNSSTHLKCSTLTPSTLRNN